jgi:hypothetical protein
MYFLGLKIIINGTNWVWQLMPAISAIQEAEIGRWCFEASSSKTISGLYV